MLPFRLRSENKFSTTTRLASTIVECAYLDGIVLLDAGPVDGAGELGVPVVAVDHGDGHVGGRAQLRGAVVLQRVQRHCKRMFVVRNDVRQTALESPYLPQTLVVRHTRIQ